MPSMRFPEDCRCNSIVLSQSVHLSRTFERIVFQDAKIWIEDCAAANVLEACRTE